MTPNEITNVAFWKGDAELIEDLYLRLLPRLRQKFGFDNPTAEDIIQQTLYKVFKAKKPIEGKLVDYLYVACRNNAIDYIRDKNKKKLSDWSEDSSDAGEENTFLLNEAAVEKNSTLLVMQQELEKLPETIQDMLAWKYGKEKSTYKEIVEKLNERGDDTNENTVRQRLHYYKRQLKNILLKLTSENDA